MKLYYPPKTDNPHLDVWLERLVKELEPYLIDSPTFTGQATIPTIDLTGGQIAFPATAVPSADPNTLDDYEEGIYVPTLTCGTSGTITVNPSYNALGYTKVGDMVNVRGQIRASAVNAPVGQLRLSIPFTSTLGTEESALGCGSAIMQVLETNLTGLPGALTYDNQDYCFLVEKVGGGMSNDVANHVKIGTQISVGLTYGMN